MKANIEKERKYPGTLKAKIEAVYKERGKREGNIFLWKMFWFILFSEKIRRRIRRNGIKVSEKLIVFEDDGIDPKKDDVFLLLDYMIAKGLHKKYKLAIVTDRALQFSAYKGEGIKVLCRHTADGEHVSLKTYIYEAKAKYIFFRDTCTVTSTKKEEQTYVQLCPTCDLLHRKKADGLYVILDYATLTGTHFIYEKSEYLDWMEEHMLPLGRPIYDYMLGRQKDFFGHRLERNRCNVFWEPTKRESAILFSKDVGLSSLLGLPLFENVYGLKNLDAFCLQKGIDLYIQGDVNGVQSECLKHAWKAIHFVKYEQLPYFEILGQMDAFISDYGPRSIDFLLFDKPMGYTVDDLPLIKEKVGVLFDDPKEMMPGCLLQTVEQLEAFLESVADGRDEYKEQRRALTPSLLTQSDHYCQDILQYFGIG